MGLRRLGPPQIGIGPFGEYTLDRNGRMDGEQITPKLVSVNYGALSTKKHFHMK